MEISVVERSANLVILIAVFPLFSTTGNSGVKQFFLVITASVIYGLNWKRFVGELYPGTNVKMTP